MNSSVPIEASGIIPVSESDVAGIPALALTIPDFEGQAILRVFGNSTQTEIACYSAVVTNGITFSHPTQVGSVLGGFAFIALISSFIVSIYGDQVSITRNHYAHSLSVLVVFAVFHHIYFTGALSMNWPSVLVAFWSNYAWSAGMIYSSRMENSINKFIGSNIGNVSAVGAAATGSSSENIGGGYSISAIYRRSFIGRGLSDPNSFLNTFDRSPLTRRVEHALARRDIANSSTGFSWYGAPVKQGLPLPGNYSGFAGTLSEENIPASNAFLTGFLWLLILIAIVATCVVAVKFVIDGLIAVKMIKSKRFDFFRTHWLGYTGAAVLRLLFISFFMMVFFCLFQFTYGGSAGVLAISSIVFVIFFAGLFAVSGYAMFSRLKGSGLVSEKDRIQFRKGSKWMGLIPGIHLERASQRDQDEKAEYHKFSLPWWRLGLKEAPEGTEVLPATEDEAYLTRFGWLSARFRKSKWWFFSVWLSYEFIRACFFGGALGHPLTQVFGLLAVEFLALIFIVFMKPFEGQRLNALLVYFLGFSKVTTVALSAAFDARFNLPRITTTVIGIVIIVIQGVLTILLMVAIVVGAISSYMSVTRNRETFHPKSWTKIRSKYFDHIEHAATDKPRPPPPPPPPEPEIPKEPYFKVGSVRRMAKIEDEGADEEHESMPPVPDAMSEASSIHSTALRRDRAMSMQSTRSVASQPGVLPYGARPSRHRPSWSSRDFQTFYEDQRQSSLTSVNSHARISNTDLRETAMRQRSSSRGGTPVPLRLSAPPKAVTPESWKKQGSRDNTRPNTPRSPVSPVLPGSPRSASFQQRPQSANKDFNQTDVSQK